MDVVAISAEHQIVLDQEESARFRQVFPGSRDVEAFVQDIEKTGADIFIHDQDDVVKINVITDFNFFPSFHTIHDEVNRIKQAFLEKFDDPI